MKRFFKILKILVASLLSIYSLALCYMLFFSPKEQRYNFAAHLQGNSLSQEMFEILKFQDPTNAEIYFEQSVAYNKRGGYEKGFALLDKAVELNPKMHLGYRGYMKLRFLRDFEGGLADFNRLDSLTPGVIDTPWGEDIDFLRGEAYFGLGDYKKASTHFKQSIQNQGEEWADLHSFVYIGLSQYEMGNLDEAKMYYEKALLQSQYTPEAHLGLAKIYLKRAEKEKANYHIEQAEKHFVYKRTDSYSEFLNEIYINDIIRIKSAIGNMAETLEQT